MEAPALLNSDPEHAVQVLAPGPENVPLGQMVHGWPMKLYLPASHMVHIELMYVEKLTCVQGEHIEDPALLFIPWKQASQVDAETAPTAKL